MNSLRIRIIDRIINRDAAKQFQRMVTSDTAKSSTEIKIPLRIERGPTDILKALNTTIKRDPTAPDYKYIDDPFLIPTSTSRKRIYTLARESGKRAAMWILQEHADLLKSELSEPLIEAFLPPEKYNDKSQVTEEILIKLIKAGRVKDSLHVYNLLEGNVTNETKQGMLELLCFYNSETEQISEKFPEERSYQIQTDVTSATWKDTAEIAKLFGELKKNKETASRAYSALISGMVKYLKVNKAWELYNECEDNNIPLDVLVYNSIIKLVPFLKDNFDERRLLIQKFYETMVEKGVKPNLETLNSTMKALSMFKQTQNKELALALLEEFKSIGIKPSLTTYYYLLQIFYHPGNKTDRRILIDILNDLESREELTVHSTLDTNFFVKAMEVAAKDAADVTLGYQIHELLLNKNNYKLIGNNYNENVYYRHYMQLILSSEPIDKFMEFYNLLVPHVYVPEPTVMYNVLEIVELNGLEKAKEWLPKLISQLIMFNLLDRHQVIKKALSLIINTPDPVPDSPLNKTYTNLVWTLWNHINESRERKLQRILWPAEVYGHMAVILNRGNEFEKMLEVLTFIVKSENLLVGSMQASSLEELFDACIQRGHAEGSLLALEYAAEFNITMVKRMTKRIKDALVLTKLQEEQLESLLNA